MHGRACRLLSHRMFDTCSSLCPVQFGRSKNNNRNHPATHAPRCVTPDVYAFAIELTLQNEVLSQFSARISSNGTLFSSCHSNWQPNWPRKSFAEPDENRAVCLMHMQRHLTTHRVEAICVMHSSHDSNR